MSNMLKLRSCVVLLVHQMKEVSVHVNSWQLLCAQFAMQGHLLVKTLDFPVPTATLVFHDVYSRSAAAMHSVNVQSTVHIDIAKLKK